MVLFDLGTHFGLFSLAAVHFGGTTACAVAVDPSPLAVRVVRHQAWVNGVQDRLRVIQAAAAESAGRQGMVAAGIGSAGYFVQPSGSHPASEQVQVETVSVDQMAVETGWSPTHVKVDVEGYELGVLRGAETTFRRPNPPKLFLELHVQLIRAAGGQPQRCLDLIRGWGMEIRDVFGKCVTDVELLSSPLVRLLAAKSCGIETPSAPAATRPT